MNKIQRLYANGCSFTADTKVKPGYAEMLAKQFQLECQNAGKPGSCNRRIVRSTLRDAINLDSSSLVLLQLTFLHRTEKFSEPDGVNDWKFDSQDYFESVKPINDHQEPSNARYARNFIEHFDERAESTNLTADLLMLTSYLRLKSIPYFVFSYAPLVKESTALEVESNLLDYELSQDPCVMNILRDSLTARLGKDDLYYDANGLQQEVGHLTDYGHRRATAILSKLLISRFGELV